MKNIASFLQHLVLPVCLSALVAAPIAAQASGVAQARISAEISTSRMTVIPNSKHPIAQPEFDTGRLPGDTKIQGITIHFSRSKSQQADLEKLIADQQNPSSPQFHKWLTPEQFGARFGMTDADLAKVQSWLEQQGFSVDNVSRSKTYIQFSGHASMVEYAFSTQMHTYQVTVRGNVEKHFAPSTELSIPSALAGVIESVGNLNDIKPRAHVLSSRAAAVNRPQFTKGTSKAVFFAPPDVVTQYDVSKVYNAGYTGTGQTIAIVGQSAIELSDIEAFQHAAGLTVKDPTLVLMPGTGTSTPYQGDESESDLDLEWSGAIAKGAEIKFVYTGNNPNYGVFDAITYAVDNQLANIISISYGSCETELGGFSLEAAFQQAATQGQTLMSASGDDGSTDCFGYNNLTTAQQEALTVDYPASSPYVTGVGGTMVSGSNAAYLTSGSAYWEAATGSSDVISTLLQYVPEVIWNEDSPGCGQSDCLGSGGGGVSALWTKPSYQTGVTGIPSGTNRFVPDVSLQASSGTPGYLFCTSDSSFWQSGQASSCTAGFRDSASNDLTVAGGTSFAAPIFSGMVALINQQQGYSQGQGQINPTLYKLASKPTTYSTAFHDITSGDNNCRAGAGYCSGVIGYSATVGYDEASGLGSVDLFNLANAWPANTALIATTTKITATSAAPLVGASDTFNIAVTGGSGSTPAGTIDITVDSLAPVTVTLTSAGTYAYTTSFSTTGPHTIKVDYSGDATHDASTATTTVNVVTVALFNTTTTVAAATASPVVGASDVFTVTVTSAAGGTTPTGTVAISVDSGTAVIETLTNGTFSYTTTFTTSGTHTVSAVYSGDATHATSTGSTTVTVVAPSFSLAATNISVSRGSTGTSTVTVTPANGYTGTVTFSLAADSGLANACYTISDATVSGASPATTTLSIDTNANDCASANVRKGTALFKHFNTRKGSSSPSSKKITSAAAIFAGLILAGFLGRYSRKMRVLAGVVLLVTFGLAFSGCGGSSSASSNDPAKGTYSVTVTGQDTVNSALQSSADFTLTVN